MNDARLCLTLVCEDRKGKILYTILTGDEMTCRVEAQNLIDQLKIERERSNVHPVFRSILKGVSSEPVYPGGKR